MMKTTLLPAVNTEALLKCVEYCLRNTYSSTSGVSLSSQTAVHVTVGVGVA